MSAPAAPAEAKDDLYDHAGMELSDSSNASSVSDVVGEAPPPPAQEQQQQVGLCNRAPAASAVPPAESDISVMQLHEDEVQPSSGLPVTAASTAGTAPPSSSSLSHADSGICCQCGQPMGSTKGAATKDGPLHLQCIAEYKFLHQPRCRYCSIRFRDDEADSFVKDPVTGYLYHQECKARLEAGKPYVQPTKEGEVRKFAIARSTLSRHNWKSRYFVLSPANGGIRYYVDKAAATSGAAGDTNDGNANYDPDADPDREAKEARRSKGVVPLTNRSRLLTRPNMSDYKPSSSSASDNDIGIIFFESKDSQKELRLIFQCSSVEERNAWIRALEAYIYTVDDPADYTNARAAMREREKAKEAKDDKKEDKKEDKKKGEKKK